MSCARRGEAEPPPGKDRRQSGPPRISTGGRTAVHPHPRQTSRASPPAAEQPAILHRWQNSRASPPAAEPRAAGLSGRACTVRPAMSQSVDEFARGTEHLEDRAHLASRLERGDRLRIKFGVDPTAPDIHLGHTVPMRRLRAWQEAGHLPVIIIGDWTARIGDPTGRSETRPPLSPEMVAANAQTYLDQLFSILDRERTEVRFQSEWFDGIGLAEILRLCAGRTVGQLLQRADFSERMAAERPIGVHELLYPLLQGYDSVAVDADLEIGGTDQLFNLLAARDVQRWYGRPAQDVATFPILEGTDGVRKMSKSYGN